MATYPDSLVPPLAFRFSDDQVYHEMAPIGHYNLERSDKHALLSLLPDSFTSFSPKKKTLEDARRRTHSLESQKKNQLETITFTF